MHDIRRARRYKGRFSIQDGVLYRKVGLVLTPGTEQGQGYFQGRRRGVMEFVQANEQMLEQYAADIPEQHATGPVSYDYHFPKRKI